MDVGKFKASPLRLTAWIMIPPLVIVGIGLASQAMRLQSEWKLSRTKELSDVLPRMVQVRKQSNDLLDKFMSPSVLKNQGDLMAHLYDVANDTGFTVESVTPSESKSDEEMSVARARIEGYGSFKSVQRYLGKVILNQPLVYESSLRISNNKRGELMQNECKAIVTVDLLMPSVLQQERGTR